MPPAGVPCVGPRLLGAGRLAVRSVREVTSGLPVPAPAVEPGSGGGSSGSLASGFGISPAAVCEVASPGFGNLCSPLDSVVLGSDLIVENLVLGDEIACACQLSPVVVDVPAVVPSGFGAQSELVGASDLEAVAGVVGSGPALGGIGAATGCLYASGLGLTSGTDSVSCEIGLGVAGGSAGSLISGEVEIKNGLSHVDCSPCSELGGCNSDGKAAMCAGTVGFTHGVSVGRLVSKAVAVQAGLESGEVVHGFDRSNLPQLGRLVSNAVAVKAGMESDEVVPVSGRGNLPEIGVSSNSAKATCVPGISIGSKSVNCLSDGGVDLLNNVIVASGPGANCAVDGVTGHRSVMVNDSDLGQNLAHLSGRNMLGVALGACQNARPAGPLVEGGGFTGGSKSYATALNGAIGVDNLDSSFASTTLHYVKPDIIDGKIVVCPPAEVLEEGSVYWRNTLVGYFVGKRLPFQTVNTIAHKLWGRMGLLEVLTSDNGFFLFRFNSLQEASVVVDGARPHDSPAPTNPDTQTAFPASVITPLPEFKQPSAPPALPGA